MKRVFFAGFETRLKFIKIWTLIFLNQNQYFNKNNDNDNKNMTIQF